MNKSTLSLLMAAMLAATGVASAQTTPSTRADVKAQVAPGGAPAVEGTVKNMPAADSGGVPANSRPAVKAQTGPSDLKGGQEGVVKVPPVSNPGDMTSKTRPEVKAQVNPSDLKGGQEGVVKSDTTTSPAMNSKAMADRKAKRAERKAMAKAKRDARMNSGTSMSKPAAPMSSEKPQ